MAKSLKDDFDRILGALARAFAQEGRPEEVAILAHSKAEIAESSYDNWNGGTYGYRIELQVPPHLYAQVMTQQERLEKCLLERAKTL